MIQISNLTKGYAHQDILNNVSFTIHKGEKLGLVGRNGHGKTTLFRMLAGLESPDFGMIQFPKGYKIAYLTQEINFTQNNVIDEVMSALPDEERHDVWRGEKILFGLDFTEEMLYQSPLSLSGGWMNRINLAKVLLSDSDMLLLDEPTNHLDIITIHWLTKFLQSWRKELILITHDRAFMDAVVNHTMGIHRQQIKKIAGNTQKLYDQIALEEEIYEKTRLNDEKEKERVEQFIKKFRAKARLAGMVQSRIKSLDKKESKEKLEYIANLDFQFNFKEFDTRNMITVTDLSFGYTEHLLIKNLEFDLSKGEKIAIIGKNGKGKSTLLKLLCNKLIPKTGNIRMHPQLIIGYYGQIAEQELNPHLTVEEEIASVLPSGNKNLARNIAGAMLFEGSLALKRCSVLSGGEKARVLLGKLIAMPTHCLFLDEPSNHLDMQSVDSLVEALEYFEGGVIFVTHNEMILHNLATKLIVFDEEYPYVYPGTYQEFLEDKGFTEETAVIHKKDKTSKISKEEKKEAQQKKIQLNNILKKIKQDITNIESQIETEELHIENIQQKLVKASTDNNGQELALLGKELNTTHALIESLFDELSYKHKELDELESNQK